MKKKLVLVALTAILTIGATVTAFAAPTDDDTCTQKADHPEASGEQCEWLAIPLPDEDEEGNIYHAWVCSKHAIDGVFGALFAPAEACDGATCSVCHRTDEVGPSDPSGSCGPCDTPAAEPKKEVPVEVQQAQKAIADADDYEKLTGLKGANSPAVQAAVRKISGIAQEKLYTALVENKEVTIGGVKVSAEVLRTNEYARRMYISQIITSLGLSNKIAYCDGLTIGYINADGSLSVISLY